MARPSIKYIDWDREKAEYPNQIGYPTYDNLYYEDCRKMYDRYIGDKVSVETVAAMNFERDAITQRYLDDRNHYQVKDKRNWEYPEITAESLNDYSQIKEDWPTALRIRDGYEERIRPSGAVVRNVFTEEYVGWRCATDQRLMGKYRDPSLEAIRRTRYQSNLLIKVVSRHDPIRIDATPAELKAQDTLRDMVTERDWRRYATNGFLIVKGKKFHYQIFKSQKSINVYIKGQLLNKICIHTVKDCPPTDHVINMKILIELDEDRIWSGGNVSVPYRSGNQDQELAGLMA